MGIGGTEPTLVLGGTGKTGSRVVRALTRRDIPVRVGTRSGGLPFDWTDETTWPPVLRGTRAAYVVYAPDLAVPGTAEVIRAFADTAVRLGVRRLVLLSGRGEDEALAAEKALRDSGAEWTTLRCSWFCQNFSEGYLRDAVAGGELALPTGDVPEPFVDAGDIADVAVAALTDDRHAGRTYELTGPRALTFAEAVAEIAAATGTPVGYRWIGPEEFTAGLAAEGVPADVAELLRYLFATVLDGRNARPADGVERALGRPARDFTDFARTAAAAGAWTDGENR